MPTLASRALAGRLAAAAVVVLGLMLGASGVGSAAGTSAVADAELSQLEIEVVRAEDVQVIKKLQRAYGYYADRGLWDDLADLFTDDAVADYPSGIFDGNVSIRAMFIENLGQGKPGLAEGRIYNHTILQPVIDLSPDGATATGRWRVLGMLGRLGGTASWADSLYRFDYVKQNGRWKIRSLISYAGSGGGYDEGWVPPKPLPPGYVDRSPVTFNLAHPADRPRGISCADASECIAPFPYPNRGGIREPANATAVIATAVSAAPRAAELIARAQHLEDEQSVLNLQRAYGYYLDRGLWRQVADLFAPDGTREVGLSGIYVGRAHILRSLALAGREGLSPGEINDHLQIEPVVDVAANGRTARARIFELVFAGRRGESGRLEQNVAENRYVKRGGVWMIEAMHVYTIFASDYEQGWGKSALPAQQPSSVVPPDRPPSVQYAVHPTIYTPALHFANPSTGNATRYAPGTQAPPSGDDGAATSAGVVGTSAASIDAALRRVQRVHDFDAIDNLQSAYGYYAEKFQWADIASLFTDDGVLETDGARHAGRDAILAFLKTSGPDGPTKGVYDSQLQLQPVIDVAADGRTARIRARLLQLTRDARGRPMWGGGIYENELVNDDGVWKYRRFRFYRMYQVYYRGPVAGAADVDGQVLPVQCTPPFHYRNPVTGAARTRTAPCRPRSRRTAFLRPRSSSLPH